LPFPTYGGSGINISSWDGTQDINAINSAGPFRRTWQDRREIGVSDHFLHAVTADADTAIAGVAGGRACAMKFQITFP
jgi:hypothetical protein